MKDLIQAEMLAMAAETTAEVHARNIFYLNGLFVHLFPLA
jgi:hypothetical protein